MKTYLLTWNPNRWKWAKIEEAVATIKNDGFFADEWSCGQNKRIEEGNRVFLLRQGLEPRGIVASGWVTGQFFEEKHFDPDAEKATARYVPVQFDVLLNPDTEAIFPRTDLEAGNFANVAPMHWNTQASGIRIPDDVAKILETEWANFIVPQKWVQGSGKPLSNIASEEIPDGTVYFEGASVSVRVNRYERNQKARAKCIFHYGARCIVCSFDFEEVYGPVGLGFIHVHHLKQLSTIGEKYEVDPVEDLRPVCPNCHAIIHSRKESYTIEEMQRFLQKP